jgi:hypothetical protein
MDNETVTYDNPSVSTLEALELISDLVVSGEAEEGTVVIEWRGVDIEITVRLPQE